MRGITFIIPNYNGKHLLDRCLPSVIEACSCYEGKTEIIVVDDGSDDGSHEFITKKYPMVVLVRLSANLGFVKACNAGIEKSRNEVIVFLNNDMVIEKNSLKPLSEHFHDGSVFGVRPGLVWYGRKLNFDIRTFFMGMKFKYGFIELPMYSLKQIPQIHYIACVSGGAGAFDKNKLVELGGFDDLYYPFYWEDFDLSYRALKRGWKLIYEPRSVVYHFPHSTIFQLHKQKYIRMVSEKNRYLLIWKNITDKRMLFNHIIFIPVRLVKSLAKGEFERLLSFYLAIRAIRDVLRKRKIEKEITSITDKEIFLLFEDLMQKAEPL